MATTAKPMSKAAVAKHIADLYDMPGPMAKDILDNIYKLAVTELKAKEVFALPGFGKLTVKHRPARKARNPRTGESVDVPPRTALKMRLSTTIKASVLK